MRIAVAVSAGMPAMEKKYNVRVSTDELHVWYHVRAVMYASNTVNVMPLRTPSMPHAIC